MDIQDKHRVTLLNAKCEVVCKVQSMLKKMDYGEDVSCCSEKLFAAIKLINRLDCYCFPTIYATTTTNGNYTITVPTPLSEVGDTQILYVLFNGTTSLSTGYSVMTYLTSNTVNKLLTSAGLSFTVAFTDITATYTVTTDCSITDLNIKSVSTTDTFALNLSPVCGVAYTTCYNCIEDSDLPKAYAVLAELLK